MGSMNWRDKIQIRTLAYTSIAVLSVCAIVFFGIAGYFVLAEYHSPAVAALLTATGFLLVALIVFISARLITRKRNKTRSRRHQPADDLEAALAASIEPAIGDWIRRNPGSATTVGLLLGVAAGYSDSVRCVLQDTYKRYMDEHGQDDS